MTDEIYELSCNLDDMTGEELGFAMEVLLSAGALDVYTLPIGMKKNRPGVMLNVLCRPEKREELVRLLFLHTTTIGVRETRHDRYILRREEETMQTPFGPVRGKSGPRTDSLYPAWREDPVQAIGHREAAGGELSRCIGIISYSSLRIAAGIVNTIPAAIFI